MGIPITGTFIRGAGDIGQFAIAKADALLIPIQNVADISGRDTLVEYLRTPYMVVYVISTGDTYRLGSDVTIVGQVWTLETGNYVLVTDKGAANGVAPLDANSKIPNQYLNQLVLSQVHAVADIAEMLLLTAFEGNLIIVADASADPLVTSGAATYVKLNDVAPPTVLADDFLIVEFGASVTSVNGDTGVISVDFTSMIGETGSSAAFEAAVSANATVAANAAAIIVNAGAITTLDTNKADTVDVLTRTNTDVYTPTADYHPATKLYVDTAITGVGSTPGGNTTEVQFNLAGVFTGDASLTFASSILTVPNLLIGSVPDLDNALDSVLVRASDGTVKYRSAASIISSNYWSLAGTSKITTDFNITRDLDTDLDVSMFRMNHPVGVASAAGRTEIHLGPDNGNISGVEWGNIMIGQGNAPLLEPQGEWWGGRNIIIGYSIANSWATLGFNNMATHNIMMGRLVADGADETSYNIIMGYEAFKDVTQGDATAGSSGYNVVLGMQAMYQASGIDTVFNGDGHIIAIGSYAGYQMSGIAANGSDVGTSSSIMIGQSAGYNTPMENFNTLIGSNAGQNSSLGRGNIALGVLSLADMTGAIAGNIGTGHNTYNVGLGVHTLQFATGNQNVAVGVNAFSGYGNGSPSVIGDYNIAVGANSAKIVTGDFNSFFGGYTGARANGVQNQVALVGDRNTFLGAGATFTDAQPTFSDSVFIGSDYAQTMASNKIYLGSPTQDVIFNGPDFSNSSQTFHYDGSKDMLVAAASVGLEPDFTGAHADSGSWSMVIGEQHVFLGGRSVNLSVSGWAHTIGDPTKSAFAGAGAFLSGAFNHAGHVYSTSIGYGLKSMGYASVTMGSGYDFGATGTMGDHGSDAWLLADGSNSINMSTIDGNHVVGEGALATSSVILGGRNHNIPVDSLRSVILGGDRLAMPAATPDTVMVPNLLIDALMTATSYGGGTITGGAAYLLAVDASGNIIEEAISVGGAPVFTRDDKNAAASVTTADGQTTGIAITNTPSGFIQVMVNGQMPYLGDGTKTADCYFSADAGVTARAFSAIVATDILYWNGSIVGYELAVTDKIDLIYIES